jgi:hypothetical protein
MFWMNHKFSNHENVSFKNLMIHNFDINFLQKLYQNFFVLYIEYLIIIIYNINFYYIIILKGFWGFGEKLFLFIYF